MLCFPSSLEHSHLAFLYQTQAPGTLASQFIFLVRQDQSVQDIVAQQEVLDFFH